jgi:hypothetical protein
LSADGKIAGNWPKLEAPRGGKGQKMLDWTAPAPAVDLHGMGVFISQGPRWPRSASQRPFMQALGKDCPRGERHTWLLKDFKPDSCVLYRNNNRWVGLKDRPRTLSMRQAKGFDLADKDFLVGPKKESPWIGWRQRTDESVYLDGCPREVDPAVFGSAAWPVGGQAFILIGP